MHRRELFKTIAGAAAAAGVTAKVGVADASERTVPALAIIEFPGGLPIATAQRIREYWEQALKDTPFAGMKAIVLSDGATVTMLDAQGRILNQRLDEGETS